MKIEDVSISTYEVSRRYRVDTFGKCIGNVLENDDTTALVG